MVIVANLPQKQQAQSGLRPINLKTDLAALADLIELVFRDTMDASGRAAIREMRYISKMGMGLNLLNRLNDTGLGISKGYVWIEDGRLVGNASIYPATWPVEMGQAWMVANVGVHPDFQRRGIARQLMKASLNLIRQQGGQHAILQVDYSNHAALKLYESLGFRRERAFNIWWRSALAPTPSQYKNDDVFISRRRDSEWRAEYQLAQQVRPNRRAGLGWLRPTHVSQFRTGFFEGLRNFFSLKHKERLVVHGDHGLRASLWIETGLGITRSKLTLLVPPDGVLPYSEALLINALRRHRSTGFVLEHPHDDESVSHLLQKYHFRAERTVWHMHLPLS